MTFTLPDSHISRVTPLALEQHRARQAVVGSFRLVPARSPAPVRYTRRPDVSFAKLRWRYQAIAKGLPKRVKRHAALRKIFVRILWKCKLTWRAIVSPCRISEVVAPRHLLICWAKRLTNWGCSELGRLFNRHQASIRNALGKYRIIAPRPCRAHIAPKNFEPMRRPQLREVRN